MQPETDSPETAEQELKQLEQIYSDLLQKGLAAIQATPEPYQGKQELTASDGYFGFVDGEKILTCFDWGESDGSLGAYIPHNLDTTLLGRFCFYFHMRNAIPLRYCCEPLWAWAGAHRRQYRGRTEHRLWVDAILHFYGESEHE